MLVENPEIYENNAFSVEHFEMLIWCLDSISENIPGQRLRYNESEPAFVQMTNDKSAVYQVLGNG